MVKNTSLCGLGQTAPNPVISTLRYFRNEYLDLLQPESDGYNAKTEIRPAKTAHARHIPYADSNLRTSTNVETRTIEIRISTKSGI